MHQGDRLVATGAMSSLSAHWATGMHKNLPNVPRYNSL